jgi:hypothetical protein
MQKLLNWRLWIQLRWEKCINVIGRGWRQVNYFNEAHFGELLEGIKVDKQNYFGGTLSVKLMIYVHQMTIFRGVLDKCPTYFLSLYYYLIF